MDRRFTQDEARKFLEAAKLFLGADEEDPEEYAQTLNMNDVWAWAYADCEYVPDEDLQEVAELFFDYGWCGILYWVSRKHLGWVSSEFHDNNRFIEFVRNEERIKEMLPNPSQRAQYKTQYTIGVWCSEKQTFKAEE